MHIEEVSQGLVEALGPQVTSGLSVNELNVDAHAVPAALNAAPEDIADVQLAAYLLQIDVLAFIGEGGVAPDHDCVPYP